MVLASSLTLADVRETAERLGSKLKQTPNLESTNLSKLTIDIVNGKSFFQCETCQRLGSLNSGRGDEFYT